MNRLEETKKLFNQNCEDWGRDDVEYLLSIIEQAKKALDDIMKIELTQDGGTMYMNILQIRNIVGMARMKLKGS